MADTTYRGYELLELVGRLGLADEPGIYYVAGLRYQAPREIAERYIDKEIALQVFYDAHKLYPWQVEEYIKYGGEMPIDQALLSAYEEADRAFVAVDRPYRERVGW